MCSAATCHLHFWQYDRDLSRATAVTRGWNGYRNKSQLRRFAMETYSNGHVDGRCFSGETWGDNSVTLTAMLMGGVFRGKRGMTTE